jgi:hypothetical protein
MVDQLAKTVTGAQILNWCVIAFLVGYFAYKEWPDFKKRISSRAVKDHEDEEQDKSVDARLDRVEIEVRNVNEKLGRDYDRLNRLELQIEKTRTVQISMSEELEIIMEALLGALGGLQELGANGPTKEAKAKIQDYLNRKAHHSDTDDFE